MAQYDFSKLLQDAKAGGAWPLGDYDFEVVDAMVKASQSSSNEMITAKLRCLVGPYAGKAINHNFVLSPDNPNALNIFFRHMTALGLDDSFFTALGNGDLSPIANAIKGRRIRITIGHRTWNGALQNDVKAINPISEMGVVLNAVAGMQATQGGVVPPPPPATTVPPAPQAAAATAVATPPPPPPPPPPAPAPTPAAAPVPAPQPAAPATMPPPPPPPPPAAAPAAPEPAPTPAPAADDGRPESYPAALWATIPSEAKAAIIAAETAKDAAAVPPPPELPV